MADNAQEELWLKVLATLDEARARWYVAQKAIEWGRGGLQKAQALTGMSRPTIIKGMRELRNPQELSSEVRVRKPGGGRKRIESWDSTLVRDLEHLMEENTAGDPMSLLRWSSKSTGRLAAELSQMGHRLSADTVGRLLSSSRDIRCKPMSKPTKGSRTRTAMANSATSINRSRPSLPEGTR